MNINNQVLQIPLNDIVPNQFQPRMNFDENELQELAQSIKEHGIIQPLVLRKMGQKYEIIAGERRFGAARMIGLTSVPAIISNIDDQASAEVALVENVQRKDLSAIEEARSYKNLLDKGYLTQEQLAKKMGLSQPAIANKLRLLNLDESVQQALLNGQISERHARSLLAVNNKDEQKKWLNRIITERLTVRQLDIELKKANDPSSSDIPIVSMNTDVNAIKENAMDIPQNNHKSTGNTFFNFGDSPSNTSSNSNGKMPNKFFNFLEDESANMNPMSMDNSNSIFNSTPDIIPGATTNVTPASENNKFLNFNQPIISENETSSEEKNEEELETLFDPMDQVELLDPEYEAKKQEDHELGIKTAIAEVRENAEKLKAQGFNAEIEELDLENEYKITITIKK